MNVIKNKYIMSLIVFILLAILTSYIKNETRIIERQIVKVKKQLRNYNIQIYEAQVEYSYLASPKYLSDKIEILSSENYYSKKYSEIYFGIKELNKINFNQVDLKNLEYEQKK